jgi:hypothetical protein
MIVDLLSHFTRPIWLFPASQPGKTHGIPPRCRLIKRKGSPDPLKELLMVYLCQCLEPVQLYVAHCSWYLKMNTHTMLSTPAFLIPIISALINLDRVSAPWTIPLELQIPLYTQDMWHHRTCISEWLPCIDPPAYFLPRMTYTIMIDS